MPYERLDEAREVVQELFTSGALGWIHAHLLSLNNVSKLGTRLTRKLAN